MTIAIDLGVSAEPSGGGSSAAVLDLEELLATRLLVQGNSGSGKSHLLRRLLEQSAAHVQQLILDPEGDFVGLAERYGHVVIDGERGVVDLDCIARRIREHRISAVLNLESLDAENQMRAAATVLNAVFDAEREHWYPMLVAVDEAQLFAPAVAGDVAEEVRKASLGAMTNLMCRGRKRGLAGIIATQRLAKLAKNVAAEATNFLMGRTFLDIDMARAADLLGLERRQAEMFRDLRQGHFMALGPALSRRPKTIKVGGVETQPRAGTPRLLPLPEQGGEAARDLALAPVPASAARMSMERRPAPVPKPSMTQILEEIVRDRAAGETREEAEAGLAGEERDLALRRIGFDMMREAEAAFRPEPVLYGDFQVRCRIARLGTGALTMAEFKLHLNVARAGVDPDAVDAAEWNRAIAIARQIPDDLQAVYLILAGAALRGLPCPSDLDVARRCGMHSAGRARSRIKHLDAGDLLVMRNEGSGSRIATFPDLGWRSAPGDPNAPPAASQVQAAE